MQQRSKGTQWRARETSFFNTTLEEWQNCGSKLGGALMSAEESLNNVVSSVGVQETALVYLLRSDAVAPSHGSDTVGVSVDDHKPSDIAKLTTVVRVTQLTLHCQVSRAAYVRQSHILLCILSSHLHLTFLQSDWQYLSFRQL